jgi:hypothetical protein
VKKGLTPGAAEAFFGACRVIEGFDLFNGTSEDRDGNHLGDLLAGFQVDGGIAEVGHDDEDLTAIAGVDDAAGASQAAGSHGGAVADEQAEWGAAVGMASLDCDAGAEADGVARSHSEGIKAEDIIAEVFPGMGYGGQACAGVQQFHTKHELILAELALLAGFAALESCARANY